MAARYGEASGLRDSGGSPGTADLEFVGQYRQGRNVVLIVDDNALVIGLGCQKKPATGRIVREAVHALTSRGLAESGAPDHSSFPRRSYRFRRNPCIKREVY